MHMMEHRRIRLEPKRRGRRFGASRKHRARVARRALHRSLLATVIALLLGATLASASSAAPDFADGSFGRVWARTDAPVLAGSVSRTWFWGPAADTGALYERYLDAPGQERLVQYYDKGRMEINDPAGDQSSPWFVTSGLLDRELISGRIQIGSNTFLNTGSGANVPVAGDPINTFPTYADFQRLVDQGQPDRTGQAATTVFLPDGMSSRPEAANDANAQYDHYVTYTGPSGSQVGYNIPNAFWNFMTQPGLIQNGNSTETANPLFDWLFVLGYPISDPVWVQVQLQGTAQWVLIQPFERRVLTYTPSNPAAWQVEMGNIGQHYYRWRYQTTPSSTQSGDPTYLAMQLGNRWQYGTSSGSDENWQITGVSRSFSAGSQLLTRLQETDGSREITYWSVTPSGLDLYGSDQLDATGALTDSTIYWPPIHYFPDHDPYIGQSWSTETTAISINAPPRQITVSVQVAAWQIVSTPAGLTNAWKLSYVEWSGENTQHPNQTTTTLWFSPNVGTVQWVSDGFAAQLKSATTLPPK